jgi:YVTN family beta-propeller protein
MIILAFSMFIFVMVLYFDGNPNKIFPYITNILDYFNNMDNSSNLLYPISNILNLFFGSDSRMAFVYSETTQGSNSYSLKNDPIFYDIKVGRNPISMTADNNIKMIYVANSNDHTISVINTTDNNIVSTIPLTIKPIGLSFNSLLNKLYVISDSSSNI